jgi:hypothetical protein
MPELGTFEQSLERYSADAKADNTKLASRASEAGS